MPQSLKKRAAELEQRIKDRAEVVKRVLREYRETQRASTATPKGAPRTSDRARLLKKRLDVERANAALKVSGSAAVVPSSMARIDRIAAGVRRCEPQPFAGSV